ncbi:dus [Scenedesmus sp. PABB004]|nr:dus [Scenedesmus sp. PABB004]
MAAAAQSGACRARAGARQPSSAVLPRVQPLPVHRLRRAPLARGIGKDVVEGWLDLAKLVASEGSKNKSPYEELAFKIGRDVYVDIAGWHLFLRDMSAVPGLKMSQALATQLGPEAAAGGRGGLRESDVAAVLKKIPVELGAGKTLCLAAPDEQQEQLEAAMEALRGLAGQAAAGADPGGWLARFELNYRKLRNWVARRNTPRIQQRAAGWAGAMLPGAGPPPRHVLVSEARRSVAPQQMPPLRLRSLELKVPLLAAPMAGLTAAPLRLMYQAAGAGLAVSEMVIASTLRSGAPASRHLARWHADEAVRSCQLYGVRPDSIDWAVRHLVGDCGVAHVDLNYGCPVRKITSRGGGSALPLRPRLFRRLVAAAVGAAGGVPVTVKLRLGLDDALLTYLQAGAIAADEGAAGIILHARTAAQQYSPPAQWDAVAALAAAVPVPVIGNGDVFEAADAVAMLRDTGARGVAIGRAALGRPWLFSEAAAMLAGRWPERAPPALGEVLSLALGHLQAWAEWDADELGAVLKMRKLIPCYTAGFTSAVRLRGALFAATRVDEWQAVVGDPGRWGYDPAEPFPAAALRVARLKGAGQAGGGARARVVLPQGWLTEGDDGGDEDDALLAGLEDVAACEG